MDLWLVLRWWGRACKTWGLLGWTDIRGGCTYRSIRGDCVLARGHIGVCLSGREHHELAERMLRSLEQKRPEWEAYLASRRAA